MGRSVSYPRHAQVAFGHIDFDDCDDFQESVLDDLQAYAPTLWPSLSECNTWLDREDHAVLENAHAYVGVSEYNGLVAYWIVAKEQETEGRQAMADNWVEVAGFKLRKHFGTLNKVGVMSNGEAVFERVAA